jgi:hypothetical protein
LSKKISWKVRISSFCHNTCKSLFVTSSHMHSLLDSHLNAQPDTKVKHICLWWSRALSNYLYLVLCCEIVVSDATSDMTTKRTELACSLMCSALMADPYCHLRKNHLWLFAFWEQTWMPMAVLHSLPHGNTFQFVCHSHCDSGYNWWRCGWLGNKIVRSQPNQLAL